MKRLELAFYCCNPKSSCPKPFCIIDGHACLFLKAQWETKLSGITIEDLRRKEATLGNIATSNHSPAAAKPQRANVAESIIKQAKQKPSENPCNFNVESMRIMEGWKK
jgi:hypothetical protein